MEGVKNANATCSAATRRIDCTKWYGWTWATHTHSCLTGIAATSFYIATIAHSSLQPGGSQIIILISNLLLADEQNNPLKVLIKRDIMGMFSRSS